MAQWFSLRVSRRRQVAMMVVSLLVSCSPPPEPTPQPTRSDTEVPTSRPSSPTAEAATLDDHPLVLAQRALQDLASFRMVLRSIEYFSRDSSISDPLEITFQVQQSPQPGIAAMIARTAGSEEAICVPVDARQQCWQRVGTHPWIRKPEWDALTFTGNGVEERLAQAHILEDRFDDGSGERVVRWRLVGRGSETMGTTWIQADTSLVLHEESDIIADGALIAHTDVEFSDFDQPVRIPQPEFATLTPVPPTPEVAFTHITVEETPPFPGALYAPEAEGRYPAVLVLHGSDGSLRMTQGFAEQLAQAGYVALAYCYFGCPGTPKMLADVELEPLLQAVQTLADRPDVQPGALAVVGFSRGGELALITGVLEPRVRAVVTVSGFASVTPSIGPGITSQMDPAWVVQGQRLPFTTIPVEQIDGPVLVLQGESDPLVSPVNAYQIADRLAAHDRPVDVILFPGRSHDLGMDMAPWIIRFLNDSLTPP